MRFSFWPSTQHPWNELLDLASHAEAVGFDGVWIADHFMPNGEDVSEPMHECFATLAGLAAAVPRVRLGSLVAGNTYRHPAVLAKMATTIDHISGGRFVLGLGAGWQENEHAAYGIDLGGVGERLRWFEEACAVVTSLRDEQRTTFAGDRYQLADAPLEPKPVGPFPLLIGGGGRRVMPRIVARYADEWNIWSTPDLFDKKSRNIDRYCEEVGRDPATITRSTQALVFVGEGAAEQAEQARAMRPAIGGTSAQLVDVVAEFAAVGVDELIVPDFTLGSPAAIKEALEQISAEVAPSFRDAGSPA
ncbi:MAG: class flavin-dependent oxidoreductase [Acidimicrobiales bacterium]|nr:class flavin-dependent oxidoreductase [Acidimicrobiales bacterium]